MKKDIKATKTTDKVAVVLSTTREFAIEKLPAEIDRLNKIIINIEHNYSILGQDLETLRKEKAALEALLQS